ncbi:MAG: phytanoyl-CoA dioxygenase family protein [Asticcacaulis sp.]|jgi:hypothetical protein|uniref:phytanoyl-CoA dioxygenase family protein n=1 Tax=Asticcacaulis sp. TaxID=1872648 RepID=UPI0025C3E500|nr:phytanoyl-CoA dioxygenase family protein [Asticcacaulis sp.]MCA1934623.1 phytanoyl-CoA dioxygenase family protein [Asticcacaulis sp.]
MTDDGVTDAPVLDARQIERFVTDGFIRFDHAFPRVLATQGRRRMWRDLSGEPDRPETWTRPVERLFAYWQKPFREAANTARLHQAYDQLVGSGRWAPLEGLGTFPVRFPSPQDPGDTGWHVDLSFAPRESDGEVNEATDFSLWRINVRSRGRALLMLFLFSDVGEDDAPTRIRVGSHLDIARQLAPFGEEGLNGRQIDAGVSDARPVALATGPAGTVYLCHPFLVHAAQPHRGTEPRFMAQPALPLRTPLDLDPGQSFHPPVEAAILRAIG